MRYAEHNQNPVDFGPEPFVVNIARATQQNPFYRRTLWDRHDGSVQRAAEFSAAGLPG